MSGEGTAILTVLLDLADGCFQKKPLGEGKWEYRSPSAPSLTCHVHQINQLLERYGDPREKSS